MTRTIGRFFLHPLILLITMGRQVIAGPIYSVADLGTLGGSQTTAWSVNRSGVVTGFGTTANGDTRGFIYETGALHAIGAGPDAIDTQAYGVNAKTTVYASRAMTDFGVDDPSDANLVCKVLPCFFNGLGWRDGRGALVVHHIARH